MKKTLKERAKADAERIRERKIDKKILISLENLYNAVYPYCQGAVDLKEDSDFIKERILNDKIFGVLKGDRPIEVIGYYNLLKRELIVLLKSPDIHNTHFEIIKILACLNMLSSPKELMTELKIRKKDGKLYTYVKVLGEYNENALLLSEYVLSYGKINDTSATLQKTLQFVHDFEASEK